MDFPLEIQSEFDYIVRSFQFVAAMFSPNSSYIGVLATLGILGIFFGGISAISAQATGAKSGVQGWFINMLISAVIIVVVINNKSAVIIHDTTTNQMRTIGGVPTVMGAIAFMENRVENGIKDIMTTIMQPIIPYEDIGKGKGFELLASFNEVSEDYFAKYPYIKRSVGEYFDKCALVDLSRGWTSENAIYHTSDIWADLKSSTKTHYSVVYSKNNPEGEVYTCAAAWDKINTMLDIQKMRTSVENKCKTEHQDAVAVAACVSNVDDIIQGMISGGSYGSVNLNSFLRSYIVADAFKNNNGSLTAMVTDVNKKNASSGFMAEKMLPRLKGMMYGMIIGIFPLLMGFIWFNPAKTVIFYAGMFILLILWTSIDTFMDMQYQNEVFKMFAIMRDNGLGVNRMFDIENKAADAVSLYGSGRWMALGLATAISGAITGANSYAISQMGSQLGASAQSSAASGAGYIDSAGQSKLRTQAGMDFGGRELNSMTPVANWNNLGIDSAMNQTAAMSKVNSLRDTGMSDMGIGQGIGQSQAFGAAKGIASTVAEKDYLGGIGAAAMQAGRSSQYGAAQGKSNLDAMDNIYGGLGAAGAITGGTQGINAAENAAATFGKLGAAGGMGSLLEQAKRQGGTGFGQTQGGLEATEAEARAMNLSIAEATAFKQNGNVLTGAMANILNEKYGSNAFKEGQQMTFGVGGGRLNNVSLRENADSVSVGGYDVLGGHSETLLGDDMRAVSTTYRGLINDAGNVYEGAIMADGNGNVINMTGAEGYDKRHSATESSNSGVSVNIGNETMEGLIRGNQGAWNGYSGISDAQVSELAGYYSNRYMSQSSSADSNLQLGIGSKFLQMLGIKNEAYLQANDSDKADMINSAFHQKHDAISLDDMSDTEKSLARASFHQEIYNEMKDFTDSSKIGRMGSKAADEVKGVGDSMLKNIPTHNNDMDMPTDDIYGILDDRKKK